VQLWLTGWEGKIITAGTHEVSSIKVAEAASVIENTRGDHDIPLLHELALMFQRLRIDTPDVLQAAGSDRNFLPFFPRRVGGHCVGVDASFLTHMAQPIDDCPEVILAGRRINDNMAGCVAGEVVSRLQTRHKLQVADAHTAVLGFAFKESCADLLDNTLIDIVRAPASHRAQVDNYDPWVGAAEAVHEHSVTAPAAPPAAGTDDAIVLVVAHHDSCQCGAAGVHALSKPRKVLHDVQSTFCANESDGRLQR